MFSHVLYVCTDLRSPAAQTSHGKVWPARGVRPQAQRVSVIEPLTSCWKRALNTTAAFNQRRHATTAEAAWALNDRGATKTHCGMLLLFSLL